jgi:Dpy-30 motif
MLLNTEMFMNIHRLFVSSIGCKQSRRLEAVRREEQELLETQSVPLRNYLMQHVMPTLTRGLRDCVAVRPDDPIDYLVSTGLNRFHVVKICRARILPIFK